MQVIPRSQAEGLYKWRYTVQRQSRDGSWVDDMSTDDESVALSSANYQQTRGFTVRVIDNLA